MKWFWIFCFALLVLHLDGGAASGAVVFPHVMYVAHFNKSCSVPRFNPKRMVKTHIWPKEMASVRVHRYMILLNNLLKISEPSLILLGNFWTYFGGSTRLQQICVKMHQVAENYYEKGGYFSTPCTCSTGYCFAYSSTYILIFRKKCKKLFI
jgi:hypothetical protein